MKFRRWYSFLLERPYEAILMLALTVVCVGGTILELILDVRAGKGLDYYFNGFGARVTPIGMIAAVGLIPLAVVAGRLLHWWHTRDERDFARRFPLRDDPDDR